MRYILCTSVKETLSIECERKTSVVRPSLLVLEVERADEEAVDVGDLLDGLGGGLPGAVAGLGVHAQHQRVRLKNRTVNS